MARRRGIAKGVVECSRLYCALAKDPIFKVMPVRVQEEALRTSINDNTPVELQGEAWFYVNEIVYKALQEGASFGK